ncbi:MAG TPA: hypothetical protein VKM56_14435, partial [Verrucomicrobiae bacterium]|nr:hypothetical protein [Verrucomicrobiae bacterium]
MLKLHVFRGILSGCRWCIMSASSEAEFDLELHFLPAWARKPQNEYSQYPGRPEREGDNRETRGDRPPRRRDQPAGRGPRRDRPPFGPRPAEARGRGPGDRRPPQRGRPGRGEPRGDFDRKAPPPVPLPELNCAYIPDDRGVESLAKQIKMTGRAYPLFEIAQMILQKPERHSVTLSVRKNPEGQIAQPLFQCALDETVWLSEEEAIRHLLDRHFATFYQAEKTQTDPPKGTYTFVAQCGMSGVILGPPNYHDYQNQLRKLHAERFSRMPFDAFKARVKIVKDEAVVKKWIDEQSWKTEYVCLNVPEALKLPSREEVEKHFRQVHAPNVVKQVESAHLTGSASRGIRSPALARLIRQTWEDQKRFPLQVATVLSQKFAAHGLQFFKVNKTVTHVAVARPHYLDIDAEPVSDGIRKIVQFISEHPRCTRRKLVDALAPGPQPQVQPAAEGATEAPPAEATPEYTALVGDLHWLIHQGHVIEFATGLLETAKKPVVRPQKTADQPASSATPPTEAPAETISGESAPKAFGVSQGAAPSEAPSIETTEPAETPG